MRGFGRGEPGPRPAYTPTQDLPGLTSVPFLVTMLWPRTPQRKGRGDDTAGAGSGGLTRRRGAAVMASPLSAATVKRVTRGVPGWGRVGGAALAASGSACSTTPEQALGSRPNRRTAVRSWLCARAQDGERGCEAATCSATRIRFKASRQPPAAGRPASRPRPRRGGSPHTPVWGERRQPAPGHAAGPGPRVPTAPETSSAGGPRDPTVLLAASLPPRACLASGFLGAPALSPPVTRAPPYPAASPRCASLWGQQAPAAGSSRHHRLLRAPTLPKGIVPLTGA